MSKNTAFSILFAVVATFLFFTNSSVAAINESFTFQGKVVDDDGTNLTTSDASCVSTGGADTCDFRVSLYTAVSGGTLVWQETKSDIELYDNDGIFNLVLDCSGTFSSCDQNGGPDFNSGDLFVQVEFDPDGDGDFAEGETFLPRRELTAVPYAFNANELDGVDGGSFLRSDTSDNFTSGTLTLDSGTTLDVSGDIDIADATIVFTGASTDIAVTGDFSFNTDDLFIEKSTGEVGIGTAVPDGLLEVSETQTLTSGTDRLAYLNWTITPSGTSTATSYGLHNQLQTTGSNNIGTVFGNLVDILPYNTGTTTSLTGVGSNVNSYGGTITTVYGIDSDLYANVGDFTTAYGIRSRVRRDSGVITTGYALYLDDVDATNAYGVYQVGASDDNYFAGNTGIGTNAPGQKLEVTGNVLLTNANNYLYLDSTENYLSFDGTDINLYADTGGIRLRTNDATSITFETDGSEQVRISSDGFVGIGTASPASPLEVVSTPTVTESAIKVISSLAPSSLGQAFYGFEADIDVDASASATVGGILGNYINIRNQQAGRTVTQIYGTTNDILVNAGALSSYTYGTLNLFDIDVTGGTEINGTYNSIATDGTIADVYGSRTSLINDGTLTNFYGNRVTVDSTFGTITNGYGFYIGDIDATTDYGIYQAGANDDNYFAGSVGIGDTSPDHTLDVAGNIGLDASGYVNWGDTDGTSGYGLRDNSGTLEYKNSGGGWTAFSASTTWDTIGDAAANTNINLTSYTTQFDFTGTTTTGWTYNADSLTTGIGQQFSFDGLTSGTGLSLISTSTALTSGSLLDLYWNPGSSTTATGDLFSLDIGANASVTGNLLAVYDTASELFTVSTSSIESAVPHSFTSAGDVSFAYDAIFTNQTSSFIKSKAPLYIEAGEVFESNDLTLVTYNNGNIIFDAGDASGDLGTIQFDDGYVKAATVTTPIDFVDAASEINSFRSNFTNETIIGSINEAFDAATGTSGGSWTVASGVIYPTTTTNDFAIGGSTLASSTFSIDESAGIFLFGGDQSVNPTLTFEATDSDTGDFGFNANDAFYFSGANVGVGLTNPTGLFAVGASEQFSVNSSGLVDILNDIGSVEIDFLGDNATNIYSEGSIYFRVDSDNDATDVFELLNGSNATVAQFTESGYLGINSAPSYRLDVVGDDTAGSQLAIRGETNGNNRLYIGYNTTSDYARLQAVTEGTSYRDLVLQNSGGDVGIGDTTPDHKLDVAGNIGLDASGYINFGDTDGSSGYGFRDNSGSIEYKDSGGSWTALSAGGGAPTVKSAEDTTVETLSTTNNEILDVGANEYLGITPSSSSNEILVMFSIDIDNTVEDDEEATFQVRRAIGTTPNCSSTKVGADFVSHSTDAWEDPLVAGSIVDNPNTTSEVRYTICGDHTDVQTGSSLDIQHITLVLMEVNTGADLAEVYATKDVTIASGDLVSVDTQNVNNVAKTTRTNRDHTVGIISTVPSSVIGGDGLIGDIAVPVALAGRVPTKVALTNGEIAAGDYIAISPFDGVGERASGKGMVVGTALEDFTLEMCNESEDGCDTLTDDKTGEIFFTKKISVFVNVTWHEEASFAVNLKNDINLDAEDILFENDFKVLGNSYLGDAWFAGDLTIGTLTIGDTSINAVASRLSFQSNRLAGDVDFFNNRIVMSTAGNIHAVGQLTTAKINIDTSQVGAASAGTVVIPAGMREVVVTTTALTQNSLLFATPDIPIALGTRKSSETTFVVELQSPLDEEVSINWWVIN